MKTTHPLIAHPQQLFVRIKGYGGHTKITPIDQHLAAFHKLWIAIRTDMEVGLERTEVGRRRVVYWWGEIESVSFRVSG